MNDHLLLFIITLRTSSREVKRLHLAEYWGIASMWAVTSVYYIAFSALSPNVPFPAKFHFHDFYLCIVRSVIYRDFLQPQIYKNA